MIRRVLLVVCAVLGMCSTALGQLMIPVNSTDQSIVIAIVNPATLAAYTGLTVTSFDIYYHVAGAAIAAKVDATSGSVTAHSDNTAAEIGMGLYEIDLPDAIWASRANGTAIQIVIEWDTTNHYVVTKEIQIGSSQTGDAYVPALAAQTAAEKIDTSTELRTLATGENKALAKQETLADSTSGLSALKVLLDQIVAAFDVVVPQ